MFLVRSEFCSGDGLNTAIVQLGKTGSTPVTRSRRTVWVATVQVATREESGGSEHGLTPVLA